VRAVIFIALGSFLMGFSAALILEKSLRNEVCRQGKAEAVLCGANPPEVAK